MGWHDEFMHKVSPVDLVSWNQLQIMFKYLAFVVCVPCAMVQHKVRDVEWNLVHVESCEIVLHLGRDMISPPFIAFSCCHSVERMIGNLVVFFIGIELVSTGNEYTHSGAEAESETRIETNSGT